MTDAEPDWETALAAMREEAEWARRRRILEETAIEILEEQHPGTKWSVVPGSGTNTETPDEQSTDTGSDLL